MAKKESDSMRLLDAPVVIMANQSATYVNPMEAQPSALQLGQNLMRNMEKMELGDVSALNTKAKVRRQQREQRAQDGRFTWNDRLSEEAAREALQIYLKSRTASASKDILINDFTMMRPEKTEPLIENASLRVVHGRRYGLIGRNGVCKPEA